MREAAAKRKKDTFQPVLAKEAAATPEKISEVRPSREGKKNLHVWMPASMHKRLHLLALNHDTTATALVLAAVSRLLADRE